jgi:hypothetical protein
MFVNLDYINTLPTPKEILRSAYLKNVVGIESDVRMYPHDIKTLNERLGINKDADSENRNIAVIFALGNGFRDGAKPNTVELLVTPEAPAAVRFGTNTTFGSGKDLVNIVPLKTFVAGDKLTAEEELFHIFKAFKTGGRWKRKYWTKEAKFKFFKTQKSNGYAVHTFQVRCPINPTDFSFTKAEIDSGVAAFNEICIYIGNKIDTRNFFLGSSPTDPTYLTYAYPKHDIIQAIPFMSGYFAPIDVRNIPEYGIEMSFDIIVKDTEPGAGNVIEDDTGGRTVDKRLLIEAIDTAEIIYNATPVSTTGGSEIEPNNVWVTQAVKDAFNVVINAAKAVREDTEALQEDVTAMVTALTGAQTSFTQSQQFGTKPANPGVDKGDLESAIEDATELLENTVESDNGATVPQTQYWATAVQRVVLQTAITSAQTVFDADVSQTEVDTALAELVADIAVFNSVKQHGTLPTDSSALGAAITNAETLVANTTASDDGTGVFIGSWWAARGDIETFETNIAEAKDTLQNQDATQIEVDTAIGLLAIARTNFEAVRHEGTEIDKSGLHQAILNANGLKNTTAVSENGSDVYSHKKWVTQEDMTALTGDISTAQAVYNNSDATQNEISNAADALNEAVSEFESSVAVPGTRPDTTKESLGTLTTVFDNAVSAIKVSVDGSDIFDNINWVTGDIAEIAAAAIINANTVIGNTEATQIEINDANENIEWTSAAFGAAISLGTVSRNAFDTAVEEAETAISGVIVSVDGTDVDPTKYWATQDAITAFRSAIDTTKNTVDAGSITQEGVAEQLELLAAAMETFSAAKSPGTKSVDKSVLITAITEARNLLDSTVLAENGSDVYTNEFWATESDRQTFDLEISAVEAVYGNAGAEQTEVDNAVTSLATAVDAFNTARQPGTKPVNKQILQDTLTSARTSLLNVYPSADGEDVYRDEMWAPEENITALGAAITAADTVYTDNDATQTDVDDAVTELSDAVSSFEAALHTSGNKEDTSKDTLTDLADTFEDDIASTSVSVNGADVYTDEVWVTQAVKDIASDALESARTVENDNDATSADINSAYRALEAAVAAFDEAKAPGTQGSDDPPEEEEETEPPEEPNEEEPTEEEPEVDPPEDPGETEPPEEPVEEEEEPTDEPTNLDTAITNAHIAKTGVQTSDNEDGADVPSDVEYVKPVVMEALEDAITAAETVNENLEATDTDKDNAAEVLNNAVAVFNNAKRFGTGPAE